MIGMTIAVLTTLAASTPSGFFTWLLIIVWAGRGHRRLRPGSR